MCSLPVGRPMSMMSLCRIGPRDPAIETGASGQPVDAAMEWRDEVLDYPHPELGCPEPSTQRGCLGRPMRFRNSRRLTLQP